jgi:hypothetical protein
VLGKNFLRVNENVRWAANEASHNVNDIDAASWTAEKAGDGVLTDSQNVMDAALEAAVQAGRDRWYNTETSGITLFTNQFNAVLDGVRERKEPALVPVVEKRVELEAELDEGYWAPPKYGWDWEKNPEAFDLKFGHKDFAANKKLARQEFKDVAEPVYTSWKEDILELSE